MRKNFQQQQNKLQNTKETQTDSSSSYSSLLDQLKEKNKQISKLQKQLSIYKTRNSQSSLSPSKITSNRSLKQIPENSSSEKSLKSINSYRTEPKLPIYSANESHSYVKGPELYPVSPTNLISENLGLARVDSRFGRKRPKNTKILESTASMIRIYRAPQAKSKSSKRLNRDSSAISELVYGEKQSSEHWKDMMNEFKRDPGLFRCMLDGKVRKEEGGNGGKERKSVSGKKSVRNLYVEPRSVSVRSRRSRPSTAKIERIDWSKSLLDIKATKNILTFDTEGCFTHLEVEEMLRSKNFKDPTTESYSNLPQKAEKTFESLKEELMLPKILTPIPSVSYQNIEFVLENCLALFKVRALVVEALKLIHLREDLLLKAISADGTGAEADYRGLEEIGKEIVQVIAYLKHSKFPVKEFVYLGENYEEKIQRDNQRFKSLYPEIRTTELFEGFNC